MKDLFTNGDSNGFGGNSVAPASAESHGGANGTNGMNGAHKDETQDPRTAPPPIAIVGMGMRLPGGVNGSNAFWDLLINKKDGRCRIPGDRYNIDAFYSPSGKPGTIKTQHGFFLEDADLQHLDASFFSMNKTELERLDPQQRMLLEVVWECMENGGQTGWRGKNIGCYIGVFGEDWLDLTTKDVQNLGVYRVSGSGDFALANRVSYEYNLSGPSMTIRTGCSSSLIGLHEACQALYSGECTSAVVGGTNLIITPTMTIAMTEQGVLSPTGTCKTFDAKADGYARGEAINAIYIKKLSDALRDGDPIRGVLRSTATNCDGKTAGMACPSSESHEAMMRRAYQVAQLSDLSQTAFVECHGTGTAIGDPLETAAVANVFGQKGVFIGSVKPNVGHSEGASGTTSLIKTVLALEHKTIPPNINFSDPNPKIPFERARLQVPLEATQWPEDRHERASVNSFGIGGANAHVVIDSAASFGAASSAQNRGCSAQTRPHLLVFSANHPDSLRRSVTDYQQYVTSNCSNLADLAYTLGSRREHLVHRAFCVTDGKAPLEVTPFAKSKSCPQINFVFTGQGAQWAGMAKELLEDFPDFRDDIRAMDKVLAELPDPPSWTIESELLKPEETSRLDKAEFSQPLCAAVQIGLVNLLKSWGILPAVVVGHSSGEIAAAYASQAITTSVAIIVAYYRGQVTSRQFRAGGMAAVGMGREMVTPYLGKGVVVACENSPSSVTLSGDKKELNSTVVKITAEKPEIFVRHLKVEMAYHSHHMEEIGDEYQELLDGLFTSSQPTVPFFSSVTGEVIVDANELGPSYWRSNLESPVLFYSATQAILHEQTQESLFLEIGPHPALAGPLRQIFKDAQTISAPTYVPTIVRGKNCTASLLATMGQLHLQAVPIDFERVTSGQTVLTDLPIYPWRHETKYWNESRITREWRLRKFPHHELLGSRILEGNELEPTWRNTLRLEDVPWVEDHKIIDNIVFPAAGYITMAGEAIRQITDTEDFTLRHVEIKSALMLQDPKGLEVMTSLRPVRLTTTLDSVWYEFSISSYNGTTWTKHCSGQARPGYDNIIQPRVIGKLARDVPVSAWYSAMKRVGLNYGLSFQGLSEITASPDHRTAAASLFDRHRPSEPAYQLHPTTIDLCLQLFTVGISEGIARRLTKLCVPTSMEELYIRRGNPEVRAEVVASSTGKGTISGDAIAIADGEVVLHLKNGKFSALEDQATSEGSDTVAGAQLEWKRDIDFVPASNLMRPYASVKDELLQLERLALLCILETRHRISSLETKVDHLKKFQAWLDLQAVRAEKGQYDLVEEAQSLATLNQQGRLKAIDATNAEVQSSVVAGMDKVLLRVVDQCEALFEEKVDAIGVLIQEDGLKNIYQFCADLWNCRDFFQLLGHAKPRLRVLEIGAGTGGTTAVVLKDLTSDYGERMYAEYSYTDISAGFFVPAKERFKDYQNIKYAVLDISKDPIEQGFEAESYDLILASNVFHATPSINSTLCNVRKLLHPRGRLFLQELTPTWRNINYIMGILPGWWLGAEDGRPNEPYISAERWDKELRKAGFSGTDSLVYDDDMPYQINVNIISSPAETILYPREVTLLCEPEISPISRHVEAMFTQRGYKVELSALDQMPPAHQDIVSLVDLTAPFFDKISARNLSAFQSYVGNLKSSGILWVTRSAQVGCKDPRYSQVLGTARTVRSELLVDFATFEMDTVDPSALGSLFDVFSKFQRRTKELELDPDWEYALFEGAIQIPRYHWVSTVEKLAAMSGEELPRRLDVGKSALLQSLRWVQKRPIVLTHDQIEVEPRAVGLNFRDILVCMGIVEATKEGLGLEGSGIIRQIGPGVKSWKVGDRVLISTDGCFSTRLVVSSKQIARMPDDLSFEEGATMPCVYSTAVFSLLEIGRLEKGQSVLIQSACGGVGIAAIQICRMIGAQIFATVGNDEKVHYLMETFGIPRDHIFNSRNNSFLADVKRKTDGRGVDIVLNSLSGELLHASWQCVADFGKMLEIGKRDFIGRGMLSMDLFAKNRSFFGIDLAQLQVEKPEVGLLLLTQCLEYYREKAVEPIKPMKVFDATQIVDAFRYMQKGQHIGKIVVAMPEDPKELEVTAVEQELVLRPDASYLLVGGLGGLGRAISTWMVEHGARNIIYLSRSAGKVYHKAFFRELETQGCSVQAFPGSVSDLDDVKSAVRNSAAPIAGVMHMSMVLRDRGLLQFTHDDWQTAVSPKVDGAWNLHEALAKEKLDFFVLFSSVSGIIGQWGQGNYAAANTFLGSFVQYRHSLNLPASVVDIGVMEDVGYVSQNPAVLEQLRATNAYTLREQDLLDALQLAMTQCSARLPSSDGYANAAQMTIGLRSTKPLSDPTNRSIWKRDIRMSVYRNLENVNVSAGGAVNEDLKQFLAGVASDPSMLDAQSNVDYLTQGIMVQLCGIMLRSEEDVDVKQSLSVLGVDSLVAIEIRNWWRQSLGLEISVLEIMGAGSMEDLGKNAAEGLRRKYGTEVREDGDTYLLMKAP